MFRAILLKRGPIDINAIPCEKKTKSNSENVKVNLRTHWVFNKRRSEYAPLEGVL
jgi:hypothetical protein